METNSQKERDQARIEVSECRLIGYSILMSVGIMCVVLSMRVYIKDVALKGRKFALMHVLGSLMLICSFSVFFSPIWKFVENLRYKAKLFTVAYFTTVMATVYYSLLDPNTTVLEVCTVLQICELLWYIFCYIPPVRRPKSH